MRSIYYATGNPLYGETFFEINEDGTYFIRSTVFPRREMKEFTGIAAPGVFVGLKQKIETKNLFNVQYNDHLPQIDDSRSVIGISDGTAKSEINVWLSYINSFPVFKNIRDLISKIITQLSDGAIPEE